MWCKSFVMGMGWWMIVCSSVIYAAADAVGKSASTQVKPAMAVGTTFDHHDRLWLARVENQRLLVSWSDDLGKHFSPAIIVTPKAENIAADGENRPKIAVADNGTILVTWTQLLSERYAGNIRFSRSTDNGKTFSAPITLNDDGRIVSHRFESLLTDGRGNVMVVWIDARDREIARENKGYVAINC
ncbi:MAG: sialidase family protein [Nitrosomonas sp.]|nr:sialidase family protein [Nitrosomonas sp.]